MNTSAKNDSKSLAWSPKLKTDGCEFLRGELNETELVKLAQRCDQLLESGALGVLTSRGVPYGVRNVLEHWPEVAELVARDRVRSYVHDVLGDVAGVVRVLLFDKPLDRSWTLPWHRDRTIAVEDIDKSELPRGYDNLTKKAGAAHVIAPVELLEQMLTLRFSIDPMGKENGQVVVVPCSHATDSGAGDTDLGCVASEVMKPVSCQAGDVFAMRPLLAHSSILSTEGNQMRRRVLHMELCSQPELPGPLSWRHFLPVPR